MGVVIPFRPRRGLSDNLLCDHPLEFRRASWSYTQAFLCTKDESRRFEVRRFGEGEKPGPPAQLPSYLRLDPGPRTTAEGLLRHHEDTVSFCRVYRLALMMECITGIPVPILRTDLLHRFFAKIVSEMQRLELEWKGRVSHYLLPMLPMHYNLDRSRSEIAKAESLSTLDDFVQREARRQLAVLCRHYVVYLPLSPPL